MKKFLIVPFAMLVAGSAFATKDLPKTVDITADIPSDTFYVNSDTGWESAPQALVYNVVTETLAPIQQRYQAKSTTGAISAKLNGVPQINSGADAILLDVELNGIKLTNAAVEVISKADAATPSFMPIRVSAQTGKYQPGSYTGSISMTFETPLVAAP
ncbi:CS1 type fimbrial major subunit [Pseudomonas defluvii]|uniref:CS1 type fimbrial major subunit n=1 Tax=Pseudomonas defluvii TaxID=1876757 RepID=UPI0039057F3A